MKIIARCQFCLLAEISNKNQKEIPRSSGSLFEKNPKYLFSISKITGIPAETVDINSVEHHSLATHLYLIIIAEWRFQFLADY